MPKLRIEYVPTDRLAPYARNARTHSDEQVRQIAASIAEFGFTNPVLIDADNGIVAGHGRVLAAKLLELRKVPVIRLGHLTEAQRRAYVIADNKLALNAGWDEDLLAVELAALRDELDFDLDLIGFSEKEIDDLLDGDDDAGGRATHSGNLADRFGVPPFSVLNAREGWWQDRKRAWLALGIESELGRGAPIGGAPMPMDRAKANATPGGAPMPAANYSKTKARGDGRGRAVKRG